MAKDKSLKQLEEILKASNASSVAVTGLTNDIENSYGITRDSVLQTTNRISKKYTTGGFGATSTIGAISQDQLAAGVLDVVKSSLTPEERKEAERDPNAFLKRYMNSEKIANESEALIMQNQNDLLDYANYDAIYKHITECAKALDIYVDNIISSDDISKRIFDIKYNTPADKDKQAEVIRNCKTLIKKYKLEKKQKEIIRNTLLHGKEFYAVLSTEDELEFMLNDPRYQSSMSLTEAANIFDTNLTNVNISGCDLNLTESEKDAMIEYLNLNIDKSTLTESENQYLVENEVVKYFNDHFKIDSKLTLLEDRIMMEKDYRDERTKLISHDIPDNNKKKTRNIKNDNRPLYLSGSILKPLEIDRVVDLTIEDIPCGCFYIYGTSRLSMAANNASGDLFGISNAPSRVREYGGLNTTQPGAVASADMPSSHDHISSNSSEEYKMRLITDVFTKTICKKIDKEYVRNNKNLKDFIYQLVKQQYMQNRDVHVIYFPPKDIVKFEAKPLFRNITFFAKLYLAMLMNMMVINLNRRHDKRVIRVISGLDDEDEETANMVLESIKTKQYRIGTSDINTILQLNPGVFDDWYIPVENGLSPLEFETLPGMDADIGSDPFLDWLKKEMMNGINMPANLLDALHEIDFARTLAAQNGNFARSVMSYQSDFEEPFADILRKMYNNEYKYNENGDAKLKQQTDVNAITVSFQAPRELMLASVAESISVASQIAETVASTYFPQYPDGKDEDMRLATVAHIMKTYMPSIPFEEFDKFVEEELPIIIAARKMRLKGEQEENPDDPYGGAY